MLSFGGLRINEGRQCSRKHEWCFSIMCHSWDSGWLLILSGDFNVGFGVRPVSIILSKKFLVSPVVPKCGVSETLFLQIEHHRWTFYVFESEAQKVHTQRQKFTLICREMNAPRQPVVPKLVSQYEGPHWQVMHFFWPGQRNCCFARFLFVLHVNRPEDIHTKRDTQAEIVQILEHCHN